MKIAKTATAYTIVVLLMSAGLCVHSGTAWAENREFSGEVVRVEPGQKQVVLNVPDGTSAEGKQVTVWVNRSTRLQGVQNLSELKEGQLVRVETKKSWFLNQWVVNRLIYQPPAPTKPNLSPVEAANLHQVEGAFAHGQMGDVEYETKRQALEE